MRLRVPVVVASVLALVLAPGASAVGTFGPPHQVGPKDCTQFVSGKAPDGSTHGYLGCRSGNYYVEGSGTSWHVSHAKELPVAVAVGGTSTFALVEDSGGLRVTRRTASGSYSTVQKLSSSATRTSGASIVASGDKWWALWGVVDGDRATFNLWEAHTLRGTVKPHLIFDDDAYPSIAYEPGTGRAVAVWSHGGAAGTTVLSTSRGGAWTKPRLIEPDGGLGAVAVSGKTVAVVTKHGFGVAAHVGTVNGPFTTHVMSLRLGESPLALDVSGGHLVVAYRGMNSSNAKVIQVAERVGSQWTEKTISTDRLEHLVDVQSVGGSARLFSMDYTGVKVRSQKAAVVSRTPSPSPKASPKASPTRAAVSASPTPSASASVVSETPTPSPSATPSDLQADNAAEDGPNLLVRGVEGLVVLVLLGGIVALVRRRRS